MAWRARLGLATGTATEIEEARQLFRDGFRTALDADLPYEYMLHGRGFADACVRAWRISGDKTLIGEAVDALEAVRNTIEKQIELDVLLVDADNAHAHLAAVAAELAWLRAVSDSSLDVVLTEATLAKGPEIKADLLIRAAALDVSTPAAIELSNMRRNEWRIRQRVVQRDGVDPTLVADVRELRSLEHQRSLALGQRRHDLLAQRVEVERVRPPNGTAVDITVCRWGCVVITIPAAGAPAVRLAPLTLGAFQRLQGEWIDDYIATKSPPRETTERLLDALHNCLAQELGESWDSERVIWVPHVLAGMPLHAMRVRNNVRAIETTLRISYASSVLAVPKQLVQPSWNGKSVLCMAVDPGGTSELVSTCAEVAIAAEHLLDASANVVVIADSGGRQGADAFKHRGVTLDPRAKCENPASVAEWLTAHVGSFDHILVAGHAIYGDEGGTLILPSEVLSVLDLLATSELKSNCTVHLSACETAMRPGIIQSLAAGLIQVGAAFVLGTCWKVRDNDALHFSKVFYRWVTQNGADFEHAATQAMLELRGHIGDEEIQCWSPFQSIVG